jgi:hypothetical protein
VLQKIQLRRRHARHTRTAEGSREVGHSATYKDIISIQFAGGYPRGVRGTDEAGNTKISGCKIKKSKGK